MPNSYRLDPALRIALHELGLSAENVARRACLPVDIMSREAAAVSAEGFFRLWDAIGEEAGSLSIALDLGQLGALEGFSPAQIAALASPNLIVATSRISHYKSLFAPISLDVETTADKLTLSTTGLGHPISMTLAVTELAFWVSFVRRATRVHVLPLQARLPEFPAESALIEDMLGIRIKKGDITSISFDIVDAKRPFLTSDAEAWRYYEPVLESRLAELERNATMAERIHATLVEMLPGGRASLEDVCEALAYSPRSLQRLLNKEGTTFKKVLAQTRTRLAEHYLCSSNITNAEVAFLLGYDDPNSFFRAFRSWTGTTPEKYREAHQKS